MDAKEGIGRTQHMQFAELYEQVVEIGRCQGVVHVEDEIFQMHIIAEIESDVIEGVGIEPAVRFVDFNGDVVDDGMRSSDDMRMVLVEGDGEEDLRLWDHVQPASIQEIGIEIDVRIGEKDQCVRSDFRLKEIKDEARLYMPRNR